MCDEKVYSISCRASSNTALSSELIEEIASLTASPFSPLQIVDNSPSFSPTWIVRAAARLPATYEATRTLLDGLSNHETSALSSSQTSALPVVCDKGKNSRREGEK